MLILSLDCAGNGCGVSVWKDGKLLASCDEVMERGQDQRLMPLVMAVMEQAGFGFDQLDRVAVTRGPGSFTGIRIGLATARGLGLAAGKPVIGIDRFTIYHEAMRAKKADHLVIIQSRRKELYCRFYAADGGAEEPTMLPPEDIAVFLQSKGHVIVTGDNAGTAFPAYQAMAEPEHASAARLAATADPEDPSFLPRPLYLRPPDVTLPKNKGQPALRPVGPEQAAAMALLHKNGFSKNSWNMAQMQSSLALDTTRGWGVFQGEKLIGFILCQLIPDQSEILAFCVHPSFRKQGWGEKLVRAAADAARETGSNLYLEVATENTPAISLYKKLGFEPSGYRPRYYHIGKRAVDALLFTLHVASEKAGDQ